MNRIKICMFIWNFWPGPQGGAERQAWKQAQELVRQGQDCTVLTRWSRWGASRRELCNGVQIRRVGFFGPVYELLYSAKQRIQKGKHTTVIQKDASKGTVSVSGYAAVPSPKTGLLSPFRIIEYLFFMGESYLYFWWNRKSIDIIHIHGACWMPGFTLTFSRRWGIPLISKETIQPVFPPLMADIPFRLKWDTLRRQAGAFIAIHEEIGDALSQETPAETKIYVLPNGVEIPDARADLKGLNVLTVANLEQGAFHKAFDVLLDAWAIVVKEFPKSQLTIVGRGDPAEWLAYAERAGCGNNVVFPGSTTDVGSYYKEASVFVLPSRKEGLSNALLEAQSWGLPAVASDIPGNRAVINEGENGFIVPVENAPLLAEKIEDLLKDSSLRIQVGANARRHIESNFSIQSVCEKLVIIYKGLIK